MATATTRLPAANCVSSSTRSSSGTLRQHARTASGAPLTTTRGPSGPSTSDEVSRRSWSNGRTPRRRYAGTAAAPGLRDDRSWMAWYFMALPHGGSRIRCVHGGDDGPGGCGPLAVTVEDRSPYPASRAPQEASPDELGRTGGEMAANVSTDRAETTPSRPGAPRAGVGGRPLDSAAGHGRSGLHPPAAGRDHPRVRPPAARERLDRSGTRAGRSVGAGGRYRPGGRVRARRAPQVAAAGRPPRPAPRSRRERLIPGQTVGPARTMSAVIRPAR